MKILLEIETTEELERAERFLTLLRPVHIEIQRSPNTQKMQRFLEFIETAATPVTSISIPSREERNAR